MKIYLLDLLRCPSSGQRLKLEDPKPAVDEIENGWLVSEDGKQRYPVIRGIPRFVPQSNYANNFGMQWNLFSKTQLDSHSGHPISTERFFNATGWNPKQLKDQWVLDAGCGAGRFAEVALLAGANVIALDYSNAVDACYSNLKHHSNLHVIQGDIYALPFAQESFPFVYSLGVLQHTPDVAKAFTSLTQIVGRGGQLCADFYWKRFRTMMHSKYLFRPFMKTMNKASLFKLLENWVPRLLHISQLLGRIPLIGRALKRIVPVADYTGRYPLSKRQLEEWALLDTFDMLGPEYDSPQTARTIRRWISSAGFNKIELLHVNLLVIRGVKL